MLAGAGSGKTRVLVHRIAWVIRVGGVAAQHVLAVTFTNKAAAEMRDRVEALLGMPTRNLWIGTFHGLSHRLLRIHWREAGLAEGFQIMDSEDQQRMIRRMLRALELDENVWVPKEIQWFINAQKDEGLRPKELRDEGNAGRRQMIDLYERYEQACAAASVIDFGELLLRSLELLARQPRAAAPVPAALPARARRRVPGHERDPVPLAAPARRARPARRSSSATTINRSTAGAARASRTCIASSRITPARRSCGSSRTTARRPRS